ncbi:alpha-mannosidase 2-like protein [Leptotrombidium deliense]|uniref:Alpha-mannosidase 2-like protein n=1 Tax=Leptotrombidium deliense TaxID=299467 RepID=A0A443RUM4_9ACAR|nr:alpha-mannosidase 2-like protein [Leptotrombidium deliense]
MDNHELVMRFYTDIYNNGEFFTDLNGLQMSRRKYYDKIPIQGNVYPMPTIMYFEDDKTRMNILSAQPLGTTNRHSGVVDVFLDRRLMQDDERGLAQGVKDNRLTVETFKVLLETKPFESEKASLKSQIDSLKQLNPVYLMQSETRQSKSEISFVPCDVHLLNLRKIKTETNESDEFSLFFHRFGTSCDSNCEFNSLRLGELFKDAIVNNLEQTASHKKKK